MISSIQNETIKQIVTLHNAFYRKKYQQFIAQGYTTCLTLIQCGYQLHEIYITEQKYTQYEKQFINQPVTVVSDKVMNKISTTATPSGIVAIFSIPDTTYTPTSNSLVLYNIQDPGNMGTLIRSAAAMGVENIFIIEGTDPYSPKVIQATSGTIGYVTIATVDWQTFLQQHSSINLCALVVKNGVCPQELDLSQSILIIGNEGSGLPINVIENCKQLLTIQMPGNTESLNASIAGSIALYLKYTISK